MEDLDKKEKILLVILAIVVILGFGLNYIYRNRQMKEIDIIEESLDNIEEETIEDAKFMEEVDINEANDIMIHITGAVKNPGIIEIKTGKRLIDVVELAGGLEENADIDKINLARKVKDEEKIHIPLIGEDIESEDLNHFSTSTEQMEEGSNKININTCDKNELMSLPGIGEKTSDKILEYRQTHTFKIIDDVMCVSGIGEKKFQAIKNLIKTE